MNLKNPLSGMMQMQQMVIGADPNRPAFEGELEKPNVYLCTVMGVSVGF